MKARLQTRKEPDDFAMSDMKGGDIGMMIVSSAGVNKGSILCAIDTPGGEMAVVIGEQSWFNRKSHEAASLPIRLLKVGDKIVLGE